MEKSELKQVMKKFFIEFSEIDRSLSESVAIDRWMDKMLKGVDENFDDRRVKHYCCLFLRANGRVSLDFDVEKIYDNWLERSGEDFMKFIKTTEEIKKIKTIVQELKPEKNGLGIYNENGDGEHYGKQRLNHLIKTERIYGTLAVMTFCEITAEKYAARIGLKDGESEEKELMKMKWYRRAAEFYFEKLSTESEIVINNRVKVGLPWN